ncbi:hypothetical protein Leryth_022316 [Lithospermum erythrorhizon]|nr:hypothetical protein Leryth_022316 [Lithospermum erythrorhizon]
MDFSFDEINELLEFFPDTLRQDPLLLQGGQTPLPQPQDLTNTFSLLSHVQPHNTSNVASANNNGARNGLKSDHIQETVGYIKELQSKIESLSLARDGMKNQSFDHTTTIGTENFPDLSQTRGRDFRALILFLKKDCPLLGAIPQVNEGMCIDPTELERKLRDYCAMGYSPKKQPEGLWQN